MKNLKKLSRTELKSIVGGGCICVYCVNYNGTGDCYCGSGVCYPKPTPKKKNLALEGDDDTTTN